MNSKYKFKATHVIIINQENVILIYVDDVEASGSTRLSKIFFHAFSSDKPFNFSPNKVGLVSFNPSYQTRMIMPKVTQGNNNWRRIIMTYCTRAIGVIIKNDAWGNVQNIRDIIWFRKDKCR